MDIDNLNVARTLGGLLDRDCLVEPLPLIRPSGASDFGHFGVSFFDHGSLGKPLPLVKDGDLIALVQYMIRTRGRETVRVTKVMGHAKNVDVQQGRVRFG